MTRAPRYVRSQDGYTLVEVVITAALAAVVMGAVTSVVLTTWRATAIASNRVEASAQIRNFEYFAYDDFAGSVVPGTSTCGASSASPCTTQPIVLSGFQVANASPPVPVAYQVSYTWDGSDLVNRLPASTGVATQAATNVTAFSWYVDSSAPSPTVVVSLTITVGAYSQSQTFRFHPRMNP